jgi:hypothetical protein
MRYINSFSFQDVYRVLKALNMATMKGEGTRLQPQIEGLGLQYEALMERIKGLFKESRDQDIVIGADLLYQNITKKEIRNPEMRREVENLFMDYFTKMETSLISEEGVYMNINL